MDTVVDKVVAELDSILAEDAFREILQIDSPTKWGDPGLIIVDEYPYFFVDPISDSPTTETAGRAGYDVRQLTMNIALVVNVSDYFDPMVDESSGLKNMVRAMNLVRARFRRLSKSSLDGEAGSVRRVVVGPINYVPDVRNGVFVRLAVISLVVDKQYQHEE